MGEYKYAYLQPGSYARGWHIVLFSQELRVGEVKSLRYFDRDLVAWRGESGQVAILDAHCPHLGAHPAQAGKPGAHGESRRVVLAAAAGAGDQVAHGVPR